MGNYNLFYDTCVPRDGDDKQESPSPVEKGEILYYLMLKPTRFNELQRLIPNISHGVLTTQLKELEKYHLVDRRVLENKPLKVEYSLSSLGQEFIPVMQHMIDFGKRYDKKVPVQFEDTIS